MAIAFRNPSTQGSDNSETTAVVTAPSGAAANDIALVLVNQYNGGGEISPPAGWSTSFSRTLRVGANNYYNSLFYKALGASESWPMSFTWTGGCAWAAVCLTFSGGNTSSPFDVVPANEPSGGVVAGVITHSGITTGYANSMLVMIAANQGGAPQFSSWSSPLSEVVDYQFGNPDAIGAACGVQASAGASGSKSVTQATGDAPYDLWLMALREGGAPPPAYDPGAVVVAITL